MKGLVLALPIDRGKLDIIQPEHPHAERTKELTETLVSSVLQSWTIVEKRHVFGLEGNQLVPALANISAVVTLKQWDYPMLFDVGRETFVVLDINESERGQGLSESLAY